MIFLLSNPKRIELNREKKTAIYEVHVKYEKSIKYDEITKTITCGFKKAYNEDWNMDYLKTWPDISVYNSKNDKNKFLLKIYFSHRMPGENVMLIVNIRCLHQQHYLVV